MELAQALGAFHSSGIEIEITEHQRHKSFCKCFHNFIRTLSSLFSAIADTKPTTYPPIPRPQPVHDFYPRTVHFHAKAEDFHRTHLLFQEKKKRKCQSYSKSTSISQLFSFTQVLHWESSTQLFCTDRAKLCSLSPWGIPPATRNLHGNRNHLQKKFVFRYLSLETEIFLCEYCHHIFSYS